MTKKILVFILCFAISGCSDFSTPSSTTTATITSTLTPTLTPTLTFTLSPSPTATPDPYGEAGMVIFSILTDWWKPRGVYIASIDQAQPELITEDGYYLVDISPDLKKILIMKGTSLVVLDYITKEKVILTTRIPDWFLDTAYWSKNDNLIVYIAWDDAGLNQIYTVNPDGTNLKQITPIYSKLKPFTLFPYNGNQVYWEKAEQYSNSIEDLGDFFASKDSAFVEEEYILEGFMGFGVAGFTPVNPHFKFSPSGTLIAAGRNYGQSLYLISMDQKEKKEIFKRTFADNSIGPMEWYWSASSNYILIDDRDNDQSYIYDVVHFSLTQLPHEVDSQICRFIAWSPDETKLLVRFSPSATTALLDLGTMKFTPLSIKLPFPEESTITGMAFLIP
jgi:hypothetical protein